MEAIIAILMFVLYGAGAGLVGWFLGRSGKDDYLSQCNAILKRQINDAIQQRDEARRQRDALVEEIGATYREVTDFIGARRQAG
jgi:hypothetical protein